MGLLVHLVSPLQAPNITLHENVKFFQCLGKKPNITLQFSLNVVRNISILKKLFHNFQQIKYVCKEFRKSKDLFPKIWPRPIEIDKE